MYEERGVAPLQYRLRTIVAGLPPGKHAPPFTEFTLLGLESSSCMSSSCYRTPPPPVSQLINNTYLFLHDLSEGCGPSDRVSDLRGKYFNERQ